MNKKLIALAGAAAATTLLRAAAAPPQFKTDFSGGIPPACLLIDGDGNTPATAMAAIGFTVGVPWIGYCIEDEGEYVACSTSWYKPAGTSDDWLILPAVGIAEGATLRWRARSSDKKYFDGYAVYASVSGPDRDCFDTASPLFATEAESNEWTEYEIDLSAFLGQDINVAFVNNSTNKARLYIDDVKVGTDMPLVVEFDTPALVPDSPEGAEICVAGTVRTEFDDPAAIGDVTLKWQGEEINVANASIAAGPAKFVFSQPLHLDAGQTALVEVECHSSAGYAYAASLPVRSSYRADVVEEFTGTWCSWCVRGIVYMEALKEAYGAMAIPLCVHESDVMEVPEYMQAVDYLAEISIPNAIVNRKYECDPALLFDRMQSAYADPLAATFTDAAVDFDPSSGLVTADLGVAFAKSVSDGNFRLAYVIVEDFVSDPDDPRYSQKNAYSGGAVGPMGGFEDLPPTIPASEMSYRDVVRHVTAGGPKGIPFSLPGDVEAGAEYRHSMQIPLPETVDNPDQAYVVALIIDNKAGEILNGRRYSLRLPDSLPSILPDYDGHGNGNGHVDIYTATGAYAGRYPSAEAFRASNPAPALYIATPQSAAPQKLLIK